MQSKEIAKNAGKQACSQHRVQFLDETVEMKKIWVRRNQQGKLELCRLFFFEFATDAGGATSLSNDLPDDVVKTLTLVGGGPDAMLMDPYFARDFAGGAGIEVSPKASSGNYVC